MLGLVTKSFTALLVAVGISDEPQPTEQVVEPTPVLQEQTASAESTEIENAGQIEVISEVASGEKAPEAL
jgi:hypothetical protein